MATRPHNAALVAMIAEPLWRRRGVYVRASQMTDPKATTFRFAAIEQLCRQGLAFVRQRTDPHRNEATLTRAGREAVARILSRQADALADNEPVPA